MNTITITSKTDADGNMLAAVTYTEAEVLRFIERAGELDAIQQVADLQRKEMRDLRAEVRDFFSESEWSDGETTCIKSEVNFLLERIGANKLTTEYRGTFIINGTFIVQAEDEDEATSLVEDNMNVDFYGGDFEVDSVEAHDIEENN